MNCRVHIREDIKRYQDNLSYTSGKVDDSIGQNIYVLPSDMNLKIKTGTVRYNTKILVSDEKFSLGKNENVNTLVLRPPQNRGPKVQRSLQTPQPLGRAKPAEKNLLSPCQMAT